MTIEDRVLADLKKLMGGAVTRQQYIDFIYFGDPPKEWTAENEADLPVELQDPKIFKANG
jgi:hypothetical protein